MNQSNYCRFIVFVLGLIINPINLLKVSNVIAGDEILSSELKSFYTNNKHADITVTFKIRPKDFMKTLSQKLKSAQDRVQKLSLLSDELENLAISSQKSVLELVKKEKSVIRFHQLWISNQLSVSGASLEFVEKLVSIPEVIKIKQVNILTMSSQDISENKTAENQTKPLEANISWSEKHLGIDDYEPHQWGVKRVQAPEVWELGYDGTGVRVGIIDTGVRWSQDSLQDSYVGTDNYGWFDPQNLTNRPRDLNSLGHGTPCLGPMVGNYGLGVAPGAKWMACLATEYTKYREDWLLLCLQFMICPTDYQGKNKDCSKAPRVVNNSWYYLMWEDDTIMREVTPILVESGINFIFCIGNMGEVDCKTAGAPGSYDEFIGVGCTNHEDEVVEMSSAGPGPSGVIKPDLVAPGRHLIVPESNSDSYYKQGSGTSVATPIVAGIIALMLEKNPTLTQEEIRNILIRSTEPATAIMGMCGDIPNTQFPNNRAGHGIINALKAINNVPFLKK